MPVNIPFEELSEFVNKEKYKIFKLDYLAYQLGHETIKLPLYQYKYNPIEMIWAHIKDDVATNSSSPKNNDR